MNPFKYYCFSYGQHNMVQRFLDRSFYVLHEEMANKRCVENFLTQQRSNTTIKTNKYPLNLIVDTLIIDFSDYRELERVAKKIEAEGHNTVIVSNGKLDFSLYVQIHPTKFKNDTHFKRFMINFFDIIDSKGYSEYKSIDLKDFSEGLRATTYLIGSYNYANKGKVAIMKGSFTEEKQPLTEYQKKVDEQTLAEIENL